MFFRKNHKRQQIIFIISILLLSIFLFFATYKVNIFLRSSDITFVFLKSFIESFSMAFVFYVFFIFLLIRSTIQKEINFLNILNNTKDLIKKCDTLYYNAYHNIKIDIKNIDGNLYLKNCIFSYAGYDFLKKELFLIQFFEFIKQTKIISVVFLFVVFLYLHFTNEQNTLDHFLLSSLSVELFILFCILNIISFVVRMELMKLSQKICSEIENKLNLKIFNEFDVVSHYFRRSENNESIELIKHISDTLKEISIQIDCKFVNFSKEISILNHDFVVKNLDLLNLIENISTTINIDLLHKINENSSYLNHLSDVFIRELSDFSNSGKIDASNYFQIFSEKIDKTLLSNQIDITSKVNNISELSNELIDRVNLSHVKILDSINNGIDVMTSHVFNVENKVYESLKSTSDISQNIFKFSENLTSSQISIENLVKNIAEIGERLNIFAEKITEEITVKKHDLTQEFGCNFSNLRTDILNQLYNMSSTYKDNFSLSFQKIDNLMSTFETIYDLMGKLEKDFIDSNQILHRSNTDATDFTNQQRSVKLLIDDCIHEYNLILHEIKQERACFIAAVETMDTAISKIIENLREATKDGIEDLQGCMKSIDVGCSEVLDNIAKFKDVNFERDEDHP